MRTNEPLPFQITEPFVVGEMFRTNFFENLDELEEYVEGWGLAEGKSKRVLSVLCFSSAEDDEPRWEIDEPFDTDASISSMLEIICLMNAGADDSIDYAQVIIDMQKDSRILTACIHMEPKIVEAGGTPYKVVISKYGTD